MSSAAGAVVIVGGTAGIGLEVARHYAAAGRSVVLTGRDLARAEAVAKEVGGSARGAAVDLSDPHGIAAGLEHALADGGPVSHVVLAGIERDANTVTDYDVDRAIRLTTLKLVGYVEVVHALLLRIDRENGSVVVFGGQAKKRPYPGSTTVSTINGGVVGMVTTMAVELAPLRVNSLPPGIVGDSPFWEGKEGALDNVVARTPTKRLVTMADVVGATVFLLENRAMNGVHLPVDGGWLLS